MASEIPFVFRGLTHDAGRDPCTQGLAPRDPKAQRTPEDQVNYFSYKQDTQYISTSKSLVAAAYHATGYGTRPGDVVKIDLSKIPPNSVTDLSDQHQAVAMGFEVGSKFFNFAVRHSEVLIEGEVPQEAVVWCATCDGHWASIGKCSLDEYSERLPTKSLNAVAQKAYGAQRCLSSGQDADVFHLSRLCPMAGDDLRPCSFSDKGRMCVKCLSSGVGGVDDECLTSGSTPKEPRIAPSQKKKEFFVTRTGKKYHVDRNCKGLRNAASISTVHTKPDYLEPCKLCCR